MGDSKLENKAWYRFLKVLYGIGWFFILLIISVTFLALKPTNEIDMTKSSFICPNGKSYTWTENNYWDNFTSSDKYLNENYHVSALKTCGLSTLSAQQTRLNPPYTIKWVTNEEVYSNWTNALFWTFIAFCICNLLLDTVRNITLYVITGRWMSYWWQRIKL